MQTHPRVECISGRISNLQTYVGSEDFVFQSGDRAVGGAAAIGLALSGLAGAATGALVSAGDANDKVTFFSCRVDERHVAGRFGEVTFSDGDDVKIAGVQDRQQFFAFAVARPSDRTIWMFPHSGRGTKAYLQFCMRWITLLSIGFPIAVFGLMSFISGAPEVEAWFWLITVLGSALIIAIVLSWIARRFMAFARLSDNILAALDFEAPQRVSLPARLRTARKSFSREDHLKYHPHARWVFKY